MAGVPQPLYHESFQQMRRRIKAETEITVYQQITNTVIKLYCPDCKPQGQSQRGTLIVGGYDHFCVGCGHDFREIAEKKEDIDENH